MLRLCNITVSNITKVLHIFGIFWGWIFWYFSSYFYLLGTKVVDKVEEKPDTKKVVQGSKDANKQAAEHNTNKSDAVNLLDTGFVIISVALL